MTCNPRTCCTSTAFVATLFLLLQIAAMASAQSAYDNFASKVLLTLADVHPCTKLLNRTGAVGCEAPAPEVHGYLRLFSSLAELAAFTEGTERQSAADAVLVLPFAVFADDSYFATVSKITSVLPLCQQNTPTCCARGAATRVNRQAAADQTGFVCCCCCCCDCCCDCCDCCGCGCCCCRSASAGRLESWSWRPTPPRCRRISRRTYRTHSRSSACTLTASTVCAAASPLPPPRTRPASRDPLHTNWPHAHSIPPSTLQLHAASLPEGDRFGDVAASVCPALTVEPCLPSLARLLRLQCLPPPPPPPP